MICHAVWHIANIIPFVDSAIAVGGLSESLLTAQLVIERVVDHQALGRHLEASPLATLQHPCLSAHNRFGSTKVAVDGAKPCGSRVLPQQRGVAGTDANLFQSHTHVGAIGRVVLLTD